MKTEKKILLTLLFNIMSTSKEKSRFEQVVDAFEGVTPDTEWDTRIIDGVQYVHGKRVAQLLSSRDTYWKERVLKWVEENESYDEWGKDNPHIFANELREFITNEDNLK